MLATVGILLLGVPARTKDASGAIGRKGGFDGSKLVCSDDGTKDLARNQQTLISAIKHFFIRDDYETSVSVEGVTHRSLNIFKHYFSPPSSTTSPGEAVVEPRAQGSGVSDGKIIKHPWPLSTKKTPTLPTEFETRVLVDLVGRPASISTPEKQLLEESFFDAYVSLDSREDITLEKVTIIDDPAGEEMVDTSRQSLEDTLDNKDSNNTKEFTFLYLASGKCRACSGNVRLYGETADRSLKELYSPSHSAKHQYLREDKFHRITAEELCDGCPSKSELFALYNATIFDLWAEGSLTNVVTVGDDIFEQETVNCTTDEPTGFETTVHVTFQGDRNKEPSSSELKTLVSSFVETYNSANAFNGEVCDLAFRVAEEAELTTVGDGDGLTRYLELDRAYKYDVKVRGSCRGCPKNSRIFGGDSVNRRTSSSLVHEKVSESVERDSQQVQVLFRDGRDLQLSKAATSCYCSIGNPEFRAPTQEEFVLVYNDNIQFLRAEGNVTSVMSVLEAVEEASASTSTTVEPTTITEVATTRTLVPDEATVTPETTNGSSEACDRLEKKVKSGYQNVALNKPATQSSTCDYDGVLGSDASNAVDGNANTNYFCGSVTHTCCEGSPWWEVDIGAPECIHEVILFNRLDCCSFCSFCIGRLNGVTVELRNGDDSTVATDKHNPAIEGEINPSWSAVFDKVAQKVRVRDSADCYLHLAEVQVLRKTGGSTCG